MTCPLKFFRQLAAETEIFSLRGLTKDKQNGMIDVRRKE
jgi:hypothetical protein